MKVKSDELTKTNINLVSEEINTWKEKKSLFNGLFLASKKNSQEKEMKDEVPLQLEVITNNNKTNLVDNTKESEKLDINQKETNNQSTDESEKKWFFTKLFWKRKTKIDVQNIRNYQWAIKSIKFFIATQDWEKAKTWIYEIKWKEESAFKSLVEKISVEKEIKKQKKVYDKKIKEIKKLIEEIDDKEHEYNQKKEAEKFKVKFVQVREKLDELIWAKKNYEALDLINSFFNENKDSHVVVIKFYEKWKNIIQKNIEKQLRDEEKKSKKNAQEEALELIWERTKILDNKNEEIIPWKKREFKFIFKSLIDKVNVYKKVKTKLKEKKLLDEVTLLIESQKEIDEVAKKRKLENIHVWLIKEIDNDKLLWYDFFAKILWKDKISWDTFWFSEDNNTYKFFLWDATWHGIQAWLIVTLLTRLFHNFSRNNILEQVVYEINNWLKQDLKSRNFITWIFFEIEKKNLSKIRYVWMWHEPVLIYRKETWEVEKLIAWWLAAWIRLIKDPTQIKSRDLWLEDWDIMMIYSDWIVESRNIDNVQLWIDWLAKVFKTVCEFHKNDRIPLLYWSIIDEVKKFKWWNTNFDDDASILILKRNSSRDIIDRQSQFLKDLSIKEWLSRKNIRELEWKTKEEVEKEMEKIKKEKQIKLIISNLEKLLITWEILKLKQEAIRHIKNWFIHEKINWYLKKAIANERKYKIDLKEQKMISKYKVLSELLKKWDYMTVIHECNDVISSDWNINI